MSKFYEIELLDPKAQKLLEDLAELNLIKIQAVEDKKAAFLELLEKLQRNHSEAPSEEEIQQEVEIVRSKR